MSRPNSKQYILRLKTFLTDRNRHFLYAKKLANILDLEFKFFNFKFGLDPILGFIPGLGDSISTALSFYIVYVAILYKLKVTKIIQMILNILLDYLVGIVPVLGDILDFIVKPNIKNIQIIEKELQFLQTETGTVI